MALRPHYGLSSRHDIMRTNMPTHDFNLDILLPNRSVVGTSDDT